MVLLRSYSTFSDGGCGGKCCALFVSITFGIITCIVLVPGLILLPLGISKKAAAGSLNPGVDFTSLGNNCRIVDIQVKQETERTERTEYNRRIIEDTCNHIYTYIFVYVGNDTAVRKDVEFESRDEEKREVSKGRCPPVEARPLQAAMSEGKLYECWKPTRPGQQAGEYRCADDDCIKVTFQRATHVRAPLYACSCVCVCARMRAALFFPGQLGSVGLLTFSIVSAAFAVVLACKRSFRCCEKSERPTQRWNRPPCDWPPFVGHYRCYHILLLLQKQNP